MKPLTILVDMDSIVADIATPWYASYNQRTGDDLTVERVTDWDTRLACRFPEFIFPIIREPGFFLKPEPMPGATEGVRALVDQGHNIFLATAAPGTIALTDKALWIAKYMPWFDVEKNLLLGYQKDLYRADVLFDDGPHNLVAYRRAWPNAKIATISYPYNRHVLSYVDLIAGDWRDPLVCWARFVDWIDALGRGTM